MASLLIASSVAVEHSLYSGFAEPRSSFMLGSRNISFQNASDVMAETVSADDFAVYRYAYLSINGSPWQRFGLSGKSLGGDWLNGSVSAQLTLNASDFGLSQSRLSSRRNYVVVYSCSRNAASWDCHMGWQIWQFNASIPQAQPVQDVEIVGVSASHVDPGFEPGLTLDGIFDDEVSTWSAEGDGNWIYYELSDVARLSYVRFAFAYDSIRTFDVQVSNDSTSWSDVLTEVDSAGGMADQFERFDFPSPVSARYVRFVGHGSNVSGRDGWNAITETDVNGFPANLPEPVCDSHASSACYSGDVWWYDSCGEREDMLYDCTSSQVCSDGQCIEGGTGDIEVIYFNNFEQDTVGGYSDSERYADWTYCQMNVDESIYRNTGDSGNPTNVYRYVFPEGTVGLDNENGFHCHYDFSQGYDELYLSYRLKFGSGFDPVLGGKLPRIESRHEGPAGECPDGTDSFTGGMMFGDYGWTPGPKFYIYHMDQWNASWYRDSYSYESMSEPPENCDDAMARVCELECDWWMEEVWQDPEYAAYRNRFYTYYGRGASSCAELALFTRNVLHDGAFCGIYGTSFSWEATPAGEWHTITERIVANTPGQHDGIAEGFIDGAMVTQVTNLRYRSVPDLKIDWIDFVSFFGGSGDRFKASKDEDIFFDDVIVYRYLPGSGQISGLTPSPSGRVLPPIDYPDSSPIRN